MPWPKGVGKPDQRRGPTRRPSPISKALYDRLVEHCRERGLTMREVLEDAIKKELEYWPQVELTTPRAKATGIPRRDYSTSELGSFHQEDPKFSDA
jgi:hypothetical protein